MTGFVAYHSSNDEELVLRRFLHVGTERQAVMRGGRHMHEIMIGEGGRMPRLRDHGSWNVRALMRHAARARMAIYLNRHEGIPLEEFDTARARYDIDRISDGVFRRLLPSSEDSWIILDPSVVASVRLMERP